LYGKSGKPWGGGGEGFNLYVVKISVDSTHWSTGQHLESGKDGERGFGRGGRESGTKRACRKARLVSQSGYETWVEKKSSSHEGGGGNAGVLSACKRKTTRREEGEKREEST